jgi:prepilin-type N-terminal cleavage/methylation domain-containing protein
MKNKHKSGLTLIELIVSLAILGILAVSFFSMFSSGAIGVFRGGKRSKNTYTIQQATENIINTNTTAAYSSGNPLAASTSGNLSISFPSVATLSIPGREVTVSYSDSSAPVDITIFLPD